MFETIIVDKFRASHFVKDYKGTNEPVHAHIWKVEVYFKTKKLDDSNISVDFCDLQRILREILTPLNNQLLNGLSFFEGESVSAEIVAYHIFSELKDQTKKLPGKLSKVTVWESETCGTSYTE
ncbi:6-carboxytetrahydropterin synthase [bacterium]|nr:6-carboxytetrahydropterin synthase [bacterium]